MSLQSAEGEMSKRTDIILRLIVSLSLFIPLFFTYYGNTKRSKQYIWHGPAPINVSFGSDINEDILIFNRVQKAGSTTFNQILVELAQQNKFRIYVEWLPKPGNRSRQFSPAEQKDFILNILKRYQKAKNMSPFVYSNHLHFIDFSMYQLTRNPIYFNTVRDPFHRLSSKFIYSRRSKQYFDHQLKQMEPTLHKNTEYDEFINISLPDCIEQSARECDPQAGDITDSQLAYFCGQGIECVKWNSPNSIKQAKLNVDKYFPVVAVLEYIDESLFVLERMLPRYFTHATDVFKGMENQHANQNILTTNASKPSDKLVEIMKNRLSMEYDFYNYMVARLFSQFNHFKMLQ